jgi:hypothetical protein
MEHGISPEKLIARSSKERSMALDVNDRHLLSCGLGDSSLLNFPCRLLDLNALVSGEWDAPSSLFSFLLSCPGAGLSFPALLVNERNGKNLLICWMNKD